MLAPDFVAGNDTSAFATDKALSPGGKYQPTTVVTVTFHITLRSFTLSRFFMLVINLSTKLSMNPLNILHHS